MEIKIIVIIITTTINTIKQEEVKYNKIISGFCQRMIKLPLRDIAGIAPFYGGGVWGGMGRLCWSGTALQAEQTIDLIWGLWGKHAVPGVDKFSGL